MTQDTDIDSLLVDEIELILDSYDDLFSDFDPRPYHSRSLSNDFLLETKYASKDKFADHIILKFIVPKKYRNLIHEKLIERRLKEHFVKHLKEKARELRGLKKSGLLFIAFGVALMSLAYLLHSGTLPFNTIAQNLTLIIAEPGGWFLFWIGGEKFVYGIRENRPDYEFYKKMSQSKIAFSSAETEALQVDIES